MAHTVLVITYHLLTSREPYRDLGEAYFDHRERQHVERRLIRRLGYPVSLAPATPGPEVAA